MTIVLLIIAILPVYVIGYYIYHKDSEKEPKKLLRKLFIFGVLSCIPAAIIEILLEPIFGAEEGRSLFMWFIYASLSIALVEELFKWLIVYKVAYKHEAFDQIYDAIVYAVFVSLGFACFENIFYVLDSGITIGLFRAVTSIPGHAADAIIMGNFLGLAKIAQINNNQKLYKKNILLSILLPTLAHGIYDYCLMTENYLLIAFFFLFMIFIYVYSIRKVKKVAAMHQSLFGSDIPTAINFCPNCGTRAKGNFCTLCGTKLNRQDDRAVLDTLNVK